MDRMAIIFTPFSTKKNLIRPILSDINEITPISTCFIRLVELKEKDICALYPSLVKNPIFQRIVACLSAGTSLFVLLTGENLCLTTKNIKGKFRHENGVVKASGLRLKYQKDRESFEFLFHTTDSSKETDDIGIRLFGQDYLRTVKNLELV
jgi:nucleoside diphosphate kinase